MTASFTEGWRTLKEVAEILRVSPTTVRRLITTGRLRANNPHAQQGRYGAFMSNG